jgi:hypothetical protein
LKRKLLILNLALVALLVAGLVELRREIRVARDRYSIFDEASAAAAATFPTPGQAGAVRPADHMPIVERLLFSADRNPIVEVQAPVLEPVKRPELPLLVGLMDFGKGPIALMAAQGDAAAKPVSIGEKVGEYVFRAATAERITLEWQGQTFDVLHSELANRPAAKAKAAPVREARGPAGRRPAGGAMASAAADASPKQPAGLGGKYNIGRQIREGSHAADPKDTSPAGTVYQGYVKRERRTPFGTQAWWEKQGDTGAPKQ